MRHTLGDMTPDLNYGCCAQAIPDHVPAQGAFCMYDMPLRNPPGAEEHFASKLVFDDGTGRVPISMGFPRRPFPAGSGAVTSKPRKPWHRYSFIAGNCASTQAGQVSDAAC
jgi:hypothetical protein